MVRPGARLTMLVLATASLAPSQKIVSAKSGLVYFVQGRAWVDNGQLHSGEIVRQLRDGETLYTERGRAEVLLNPGTVLRLGDMSRLRMDDVRLTDSCVSILAGSVVVTVKVLPKPDRVALRIGGGVVVLTHPGVYRFDSGKYDVNQARLRVYDGRAEAHRGSAAADVAVGTVMVKHGKSVVLDGLQVAKFDIKDTDALQRWAEARARTPQRRGLQPIPPRLGTAASAQPQKPGGFQGDSSPIVSNLEPPYPGP
jgi:hypothetical protein